MTTRDVRAQALDRTNSSVFALDMTPRKKPNAAPVRAWMTRCARDAWSR